MAGVSDPAIAALAEAAGLIPDWEDMAGRACRASDETLRTILTAMGLPCATPAQARDSRAGLAAAPPPALLTADAGTAPVLPPGFAGGSLHLEAGGTLSVAADGRLPPIEAAGYHRLVSAADTITLAVAPRAAPRLTKRRWGLAVQLYGLRGSGPIGDFAALAEFARHAAVAGADALAISPVHALFAADPARYSPYSPSSRTFLNPLYAAAGAPPADDGGALIDWPSAAAAGQAALRRACDRADPAAIDAFAAAGGVALRDHARFEALHGHFFRTTGARGWQDWPAAFHDPAGAAVAQFAAEKAGEVRFHVCAQMLADRSLAAAQAAARGAGMRIGLIGDLAVGLDAGGSHAWARPGDLLQGIGIGAPPDAIQPAGQNWGITSFSPQGLAAAGFAPFIATVRAALAHAGGLRIDHALGLRRLWVVPAGADGREGVYLRMPEADLLRLIALEAHRAGAIAIGEDLGVVPAGFRDGMTTRAILGMRVLPFERDGDGVTPPADWSPRAVAMTSTHDLPTVSGWWQGRDIAWRERLGAAGDRAAETADRAADRTAFWDAALATGIAHGPPPADPAPVVDAAIAYVAAAACDLAIVPAEDLLGLDEAPNLPGTIDEHPNWRRRLPAAAADLFARPDVAARTAILRQARPA